MSGNSIESQEWDHFQGLLVQMLTMISLMSWNCQGVKANGIWLTNVLTGINIVALQETGLFGHEERFLNLSDKHFVLNHSSMPNDKSLLGRPYDDLAF